MSNMSYCRFENTNRDLGDCQSALESLFACDVHDEDIGDRGLSHRERQSAIALVKACRDICQLVMDEIGANDFDALDNDSAIEDAINQANEYFAQERQATNEDHDEE